MNKPKTHYINGDPVATETEHKITELDKLIDVSTPRLQKAKDMIEGIFKLEDSIMEEMYDVLTDVNLEMEKEGEISKKTAGRISTVINKYKDYISGSGNDNGGEMKYETDDIAK